MNRNREGETPYGTKLNHEHTEHEVMNDGEDDQWRPTRPRQQLQQQQPTTIYDMAPYRRMHYQRPGANPTVEGENDDLAIPGDTEFDGPSEDEGEDEIPNGSRGGIHVSLSALDRRPGRPPFHHMGPTNIPNRVRMQQQQRRRMMLAKQLQQQRNTQKAMSQE